MSPNRASRQIAPRLVEDASRGSARHFLVAYQQFYRCSRPARLSTLVSTKSPQPFGDSAIAGPTIDVYSARSGRGGTPMKLRISNTRLRILCQAIGIVLLAGSIYA